MRHRAFSTRNYFDQGPKLLLIITNRFDVSPNEVADMYQARWQIELFFKHLEQNVTINACILKANKAQSSHTHLDCDTFDLFDQDRAEFDSDIFSTKTNVSLFDV